MNVNLFQVPFLALVISTSFFTSSALALTINGREVGQTSTRIFSVREYCSPTGPTRNGRTPYSPSDPSFVIADYRIIRDQIWARSGRSITEIPPDFNFASYSEYLNEYNELIDAHAQDGNQEYRARYEREKRELQQTIERLRSSHGSIIVDWHCEGDGIFGGRGKVDVDIEVTLMYLPQPHEISTYLAEARQSLPPTVINPIGVAHDYALVNAGGLCLDVHSSDMQRDGGNVQVWTCNGAPQQQWNLENGALVNAGGLCLDVHSSDMQRDGGNVQVWTCSGTPPQQWNLERLEVNP